MNETTDMTETNYGPPEYEPPEYEPPQAGTGEVGEPYEHATVEEPPDLKDVPDRDELEAAQDKTHDRPRRRLPRLTAILALAAAVVVGFLVGVLVEKRSVPAAAALGAGTGRRAAGGAGGGFSGAGGTGGGGGGAAGTGGGAVFGQVALVDGPNVYVTDANGNTVKVATNAATSITKSAPTPVNQLVPGDTVVARGQTGSDGTVTATAVSDQGPGTANEAGNAPGGGGAGGGFPAGGFPPGGFPPGG